MSVVVEVSELRRLLSSQKPGRGAEAQLEKLENAPGFDVALLVRAGRVKNLLLKRMGGALV